MAKAAFFSEIREWTETTNTDIAKETVQVARTVFTMITDRSPILTGRFVANWHVGPTDVNYSTLGTMSWDQKISEIKAVLSDDYFLKYDKAYFVNNVEYAKRIEEDGWGDVGGRMAYSPVANALKKIGNGFAPVGQTIGAISGGIA